MMTFEMEAAEALAGLAGDGERRTSERVLVSDSQDRAVGAQQVSGNTSATVAGPVHNAKDVETALGETRTSRRSKVGRRPKQNLTEAEKEARKLSRVLANRESARRTIRRRQTMYLELTEKVASSLEENTYLKKEKELVMKRYNSLKDKNEFLKAEIAKRKMAESGERRGAQSNHAAPPMFLYNHPSLVPFFWPTVVPSSDALNPQYIPNPEGMAPICERHCSKQGQVGDGGISTKPGTPVFLLPVPWLLPLPTQVNTLESQPRVSRQNDSSHIHQCHTCSSSVAHVQEDNHQSSLKQNTRSDAGSHGFLEKNQSRPFMSSSRKLENAVAAVEARIKRKELMKIKKCQGHKSDT